jgi:hypothetical protein
MANKRKKNCVDIKFKWFFKIIFELDLLAIRLKCFNILQVYTHKIYMFFFSFISFSFCYQLIMIGGHSYSCQAN